MCSAPLPAAADARRPATVAAAPPPVTHQELAATEPASAAAVTQRLDTAMSRILASVSSLIATGQMGPAEGSALIAQCAAAARQGRGSLATTGPVAARLQAACTRACAAIITLMERRAIGPEEGASLLVQLAQA